MPTGARCIRVAASVLRSFGQRRLDQPELHVARLAAQQAYEQAGLGPQDMDVAEVHDATAMGEIIQVENLGFVPAGEGGPAAERGEFALGGRLPVNTSGGLESRGHPLGATGLGPAARADDATARRGRCTPGARARVTPSRKTTAASTASRKPPWRIHILSR